ncbi:unnamed protein product [Ceutorhynchus assimilis]|uniref:Uncharacterized protein n=1 Tax=Ceutorhynchus assimilis TaxID=467358 RepID=A0A9N9MJ37_9CUCU|nr:unnamed protein product [Ceutorhynchus assimilis]
MEKFGPKVKNDLDTERLENEKLRQHITDLTRIIKDKEQEVDYKIEEIDQLKKELEMKDREITLSRQNFVEDLMEEVAAGREDIENLNTEIGRMLKINCNLTYDLEKYLHDIDDLKRENRKLKETGSKGGAVGQSRRIVRQSINIGRKTKDIARVFASNTDGVLSSSGSSSKQIETSLPNELSAIDRHQQMASTGGSITLISTPPSTPVSACPISSESESDEDEEGSVDLFEEESEASSGDEAKIAKFKDYFVSKDDEIPPKRKTNKLMEELDQEDDDDDDDDLINDVKSTLELRQERLQKKIEDLEEQAITEKSWQLKGEITAESRPQNSLLQEIVEFDLTTRPAPVITEQTSLQLEDIIRQRIKNKTFDSVEKISRPIETPLEYRKKLVLDQEKSKESLANIYEKEFLEQQAKLDKDNVDAPEKEPETHKELKKLMKSLFNKLDALSNYHFTSTPAIPELKIVSNLPAVNMEEVAPVATSDGALLAPEEIRNKTKGDVLGKGEKTGTDKKRERRKKKLKQKIHAKRKAKIEEVVAKKKKERVKA